LSPLYSPRPDRRSPIADPDPAEDVAREEETYVLAIAFEGLYASVVDDSGREGKAASFPQPVAGSMISTCTAAVTIGRSKAWPTSRFDR
jgi:hypothetical protein